MTVLGPVLLEARDDVSAFDSGVPQLDALSAGSVRPDHAPARIGRGQGSYDLPIVVLTRLGVDRTIQGKGFGASLLKDVIVRVVGAADIVGARALHAHAKDDGAKRFYEHFGFEPSPVDPHAMFLLMEDLRAAVGQG